MHVIRQNPFQINLVVIHTDRYTYLLAYSMVQSPS